MDVLQIACSGNSFCPKQVLLCKHFHEGLGSRQKSSVKNSWFEVMGHTRILMLCFNQGWHVSQSTARQSGSELFPDPPFFPVGEKSKPRNPPQKARTPTSTQPPKPSEKEGETRTKSKEIPKARIHFRKATKAIGDRQPRTIPTKDLPHQVVF